MRRLAMGMVGLLWMGGSMGTAWALPSKQTPNHQNEARRAFDEGYHHQKAGHFAAAIQSYEASLRDDPHQAEALNNIGFCYKSLKEYQKAIRHYKDALELEPKLAEAHEYLEPVSSIRANRVARTRAPGPRRDDDGVVAARRRGGATTATGPAAATYSLTQGWADPRRRAAWLVARVLVCEYATLLAPGAAGG